MNNRRAVQKYFVLTSPETMQVKLNDYKKKEEKVEAVKNESVKATKSKRNEIKKTQNKEL